MLGIDPSVMVHRLNVSPSFSLARQKKRVFICWGRRGGRRTPILAWTLLVFMTRWIYFLVIQPVTDDWLITGRTRHFLHGTTKLKTLTDLDIYDGCVELKQNGVKVYLLDLWKESTYQSCEWTEEVRRWRMEQLDELVSDRYDGSALTSEF